MKDINELKAAKREFALVGGASGTGKTTFVEAFSLLYKNVIKEKDEFDKELKELIGDYIQKITINLNEMPLEYFELNQKEMNYIIPIRMLFQFLTDTALIDIDFKNFIEKNRNLRRRISLNDIVNLIYGDKKVFILHIDETQLLFDQKSVIEYKQDRRSSVQYKFLESIFQLTQPHSKIILPVLSGTNILATINSFLNSGFRYYPIYFELLRWNHFEKIIKDLFNDNNVTFPKIFRDMTELLVGHPRLFSSYITCASNCDEILSYSAKGNTNINWSVNSREDPRFFNKEGFRKFLSDLQRKEGIEKAWRAMHAVNTEFMRLMPETNRILTSENDPFWLSTKQRLMLDILEQSIVKREDICYANDSQQLNYGDLENYGLIFLEPVDRLGGFKVMSPIIISSQLYKSSMRVVEEPVLSLTYKLDASANEKQDICTVINRLHYYKDPFTNHVDLGLVFPTLFQKGYSVKIPVDKRIDIKQLYSKIDSLEKAAKLDNEVAFLNCPQTSWGDSILKLEYTETKMDKKFIGLILQSKRNVTDKKIQLLEMERYIEHLFRSIQNDKSEIDWHYIFITDANDVDSTFVLDFVHFVTRREHEKFYGIYRSQLRKFRSFYQEEIDFEQCYNTRKGKAQTSSLEKVLQENTDVIKNEMLELIKQIGFKKVRKIVSKQWNITASSIEKLAISVISSSKTVNDIRKLLMEEQ
jgi:energy-coupling factor transporter ATP-binding protein EcfA2